MLILGLRAARLLLALWALMISGFFVTNAVAAEDNDTRSSINLDLIPRFANTVYVFRGGPYDGQHGFAFSLWNRSGEPLAFSELPGSFRTFPFITTSDPVAILNSGEVFDDGSPVWAGGGERFDPLFADGPETLNPNPSRAQRPATFIAVFPGDVRFLFYRIGFLPALGILNSRTRVIVDMDPVALELSIDEPADGAVVQESPVAVTGTVSDPTAVVTVNGAAATLNGTSFNASVPLTPGDNEIIAEASNAAGQTASAAITIRFEPPPVTEVRAVAGFAITAAVGDSVVLDGSASTSSDGRPLSYAWQALSLPSSSTAALDNPKQVRPAFTLDAAGDYVFELTVTANGQSATSSVRVSTLNSPPQAVTASDRLAAIGDSVRLDASASWDFDGDPLSYQWTVATAPAGSIAAPADPAAVTTTLALDQPGTYQVELVVDDGIESSTAAVQTFSTDALPPTAAAAADGFARLAAPARFDARDSRSANADRLNYRWDLLAAPSGSGALLNDADQVDAALGFDLDGDYVAQVRVDDGLTQSSPSAQLISTVNTRPVADAGPDQSAVPGATVMLDGSGSYDLDGDRLQLHWALLSQPAGSMAALDDNASLRPTFVMDQPGRYVAQLRVSDGSLSSIADTVSIASDGLPPVAVAGDDRTIATGAVAVVDGGASFDPDNDSLSYHWTLVSAPTGSGAALQGADQQTAQLTPDLDGAYVLSLVVNDGAVDSAPASLVISTINSRPLAVAAADDAVIAGDLVTLDGSAAFDPDQDGLTYRWSISSAPPGSVAAPFDPAAATTAFTADLAGTYLAQLLVNDGSRSSLAATVVIEASANTPPEFVSVPPLSTPLGQDFNYDADAVDAQNDAISYSLETAPPGMSIDAVSGVVSWLPVEVGTVSVVIRATDSRGAFTQQSFGLTVEAAANLPPQLTDPGPQSVALGSELNLTLLAQDPNGDDVFFVVNPLPLPSGASLDSATGVFRFRPTADQVGALTLTFIVSDGEFTDQVTVSINVTSPPAGAPTRLSGRLLDANEMVNNQLEVPVVGATVSLLDAAVSAVTDADGRFLLSGVPAGTQLFDIDASTAQPGPGGALYTDFRHRIELIENAENIIERPFYLSQLAVDSVTTVDPSTFTVVTNADLGISITIPPFTAVNEDGSPYTGELSISEVPGVLTPVELPAELSPAFMISIQPAGIRFNQPAAITMPNLFDLDPGAQMIFWSFDPLRAGGVLEVSADGAEMFTRDGGVEGTSWHAAMQPGGDGDDDDNEDDKEKCCDRQSGSFTAVGEGNLTIDHELPGYRSVGVERRLRLVYDSNTAAPQPILKVPTRTRVFRPATQTISTTLEVAGLRFPDERFTDASGFSRGEAASLILANQFDARALPTGRYRYRFGINNGLRFRGGVNRVTQFVEGDVLVNNRRDSAIGVGWSLDGLSRLIPDSNGGVLLSEGNGSLKPFGISQANVAFESLQIAGPEDEFSFLDDSTRGGYQLIDMSGDGRPDLLGWDRNTSAYILPAQAGGGFPVIREFFSDLGPFEGGDAENVSVADFNQDGVLDLAVQNGASDNIAIHLGIGGGFAQQGNPFDAPPPEPVQRDNGAGAPVRGGGGGGGPGQPPPAPDVLRLRLPENLGFIAGSDSADLDQDGLPDVIVQSNSAEDLMYIFYGGADLDFSDQRFFAIEPGASGRFIIADLNGDSLPDIAADSGDSEVTVLLNQGNRDFSRADFLIRPDLPFGADPRVVEAADFDGDGDIDLLFDDSFGASTEQVVVLLGDGAGDFSERLLLPRQDDGFVEFIADMNNDGLPDVVARDSMFPGAEIAIYINNGASGFFLPVVITTTANSNVRPGDIDGDGLLDLLLPLSRELLVFRNIPQTGGTQLVSPQGEFSGLVRNLDGSFTRSLKDGTRIEFNADGLQVARVDRNQNTTQYVYDAQQRLQSIVDPVGLITQFTYVGGRLDQVQDPTGRITRFEHDDQGHLTRIIDADNSERRFDYTAGLVQTQQLKRGFSTQYSFNFAGRNVATQLPDGSSRGIGPGRAIGLINPESNGIDQPAPPVTTAARFATFTDGRGGATQYRTNRFGAAVETLDALGRRTITRRDLAGNPTRVITPRGRERFATYDERGNLVSQRQNGVGVNNRESRIRYDAFSLPVSITDFAGLTTTINRDANGNPQSLIDAQGNTVSRSFDSRGRVTLQTDQNGRSTSYAYDANGNLSSISNAAGEVTQITRDTAGNIIQLITGFGTAAAVTRNYSYDSLNRLTSFVDGVGSSVQFRYDAAGNMIESEDDQGNVIIRQYDELDRLIAVDDPASGLTTLARDAAGNVIAVTDDSGAVTRYAYDLAGQLISTTDANGQTTQFTYDMDGNLVQVTDAAGGVTAYEYDGYNRLIARTDPLGATTTYQYDARDNVTQVIDARGQVLTSVYDELDRLLSLTTPDNTLTLNYDPAGNLLSATDDDSSLQFTYDPENRLLTATTSGSASASVTLTYGYNERGLRSSLQDSFGGVQSYQYDDADRLQTLTTASNAVIGLSYDSAGRPQAVAFPNNVSMQAEYDVFSRHLSSLAYTQSGVDLARFVYSYNQTGNITAISESGAIGSALKTYNYDALQRLTAAGTASAPESYAYDALGNRTTSHLSSLHVVNSANQLTEDQQFFYSYDANGNLSARTAKIDGAMTFYSWDAQDQLVRIERPDGTLINYAYDALGRRIQKDVGGAITRYVYDDEDIYLEVDGSDTLRARYSHGDRTDQPLAFQRDGMDYYYHADHQGSIRLVTDAAGSIVNQYEYDAYGRVLQSVEAVAQPYGYTAREQDVESNLYYYRARYYDPRTGRFVSVDPSEYASGDFNPYRYVASDPVRGIDPEGEIGIVGGLIAAGIETGIQLFNNGGRFDCLDLADIAIAGLAGAVLPGGLGAARRAYQSGKKARRAYNRLRRQKNPKNRRRSMRQIRRDLGRVGEEVRNQAAIQAGKKLAKELLDYTPFDDDEGGDGPGEDAGNCGDPGPQNEENPDETPPEEDPCP
ncbi:MAG: hypothetical protein Tsb002_17970 [Wenzhouxiangellaceae bacterium]